MWLRYFLVWLRFSWPHKINISSRPHSCIGYVTAFCLQGCFLFLECWFSHKDLVVAIASWLNLVAKQPRHPRTSRNLASFVISILHLTQISAARWILTKYYKEEVSYWRILICTLSLKLGNSMFGLWWSLGKDIGAVSWPPCLFIKKKKFRPIEITSENELMNFCHEFTEREFPRLYSNLKSLLPVKYYCYSTIKLKIRSNLSMSVLLLTWK